MAGQERLEKTLAVVLREHMVPEGEATMSRAGLGGVALMMASMVAWSWIGPIAAIGIGAGLTLGRMAMLRKTPKWTTVTRRAKVTISEAGIRVAHDPLVKREDITQAYFQPRSTDRPTVRCLGRGHELLFEAQVEDEHEARELLAALGQDASQVRSEFRATSPHLNGPVGAGITMVACILSVLGAAWLYSLAGGAAAAPVLVSLVALLVLLNLQQRVEVGVDGVLIHWLGRKRFFPFSRIREVIPKPGHVVLQLEGGETYELWPAAGRLGPRHAGLELDALAARIEEARRDRPDGVTELAAFVARGERGVAEWRAELGRLHDPEVVGGYRTRAARGEDLWRVVEDTTAPEDARAGAAIALRKEADAEPRLRIAAEAVASPKLRIALERAADPEADEAALDEALEAFRRAD